MAAVLSAHFHVGAGSGRTFSLGDVLRGVVAPAPASKDLLQRPLKLAAVSAVPHMEKQWCLLGTANTLRRAPGDAGQSTPHSVALDDLCHVRVAPALNPLVDAYFTAELVQADDQGSGGGGGSGRGKTQTVTVFFQYKHTGSGASVSLAHMADKRRELDEVLERAGWDTAAADTLLVYVTNRRVAASEAELAACPPGIGLVSRDELEAR